MLQIRDMLRAPPIWVKLPQLPLHLWGSKELRKKVEYERRPQYYEKGQKVGHSCNKERKMPVKIWKSKPDIVEEEDNLRKMMQERNGEDNGGGRPRCHQPYCYNKITH